MADEAHEQLRALEERLGRATEAAERLISQTADNRAQAKPPPAGWQSPAPEGSGRPMPELEALVAALAPLRELIPPDAADRLLAAVKEILMAIRALIDYYLERLDRRAPDPPEVQDIPLR